MLLQQSRRLAGGSILVWTKSSAAKMPVASTLQTQKIVILNAAVIVFTFIAQPYLNSYVSLAMLLDLLKLTRPSIPIQFIRNTPYANYSVYTLQIVLLINMAITLSPLFRRPDACEDIPLTPQQRHALGLPPMSRPATPQEEAQYFPGGPSLSCQTSYPSKVKQRMGFHPEILSLSLRTAS